MMIVNNREYVKPESGSDLVLTIDFENLNDFNNYKINPAHQAFIEFNKQYSVAKTAVDYII
jgi:hypothetical protein